MACPGGCMDGGGHLRSKKAYLSHAQERRDTLFEIDRKTVVRQSRNNHQVRALYRDFLGKPQSELRIIFCIPITPTVNRRLNG